MLASSARAVPAILESPASFDFSCTSEPCTPISTPRGAANCNVPFGPFTVTASLAILHSTPFGNAIGFLATRDIVVLQLRDGADDFAADALLARLRVGHDSGRRRDDRDAEPAHDLGQFVLVAVDAQAGTRHAVELVDGRATFEILQRDFENRLVVLG